MRMFAGLLALLLAGCGGGSSPPPVVIIPPIIQPPPITPGTPWQVTAASSPMTVGLDNGIPYIDFPVCGDPKTCHISYVEEDRSAALTGYASVTLTYSIVGNAPVFDGHSNADNNCEPNVPHVLIILRQTGDNGSGQGPFAFYRWFSTQDAQPLALGDHTLTVPLTVDRWTPVFSSTPEANAAGYATALANMGKWGFGFGGGCFAAHGVAVTFGSARLVNPQMTVQ